MKTKEEIKAKQEKYTNTQVPLKYKRGHAIALSGESKAACIRDMCRQCVGYEDVTARVDGCTAYNCALWSVRPLKSEVAVVDEKLPTVDGSFSPTS